MKLQIKVSYLLLLGIAAAALLVSGCTIAKISGRGSIPLILNQPEAKVEVIQRVEHSKHIMFDYTSAFDVSEVLSEILVGSDADAIINVAITVQTTVADFLLNLVTLGIAQSKTFKVSCDVVKAPEGLGSISIPGSQTLAESSNLDDLVPLVFQDSQRDRSSTMIVRVQQGENGPSYKLIRYNLDTTGR